jgi:hypothetical protein
MAFSATEAAFEGFRVIRRNPQAVAIWGLLYLLLIGAVVGVFVAGLAPVVRLETPDPAGIGAVLNRLWPILLLSVAVMLAASVVFNAAILRAVLEPEEGRGAFIRLGPAELRLLSAHLVLMAIWLAFLVVCIGATIVLARALPEVWSWLLILLLLLGATGLTIFAAVRLSLVLPISFAEGGLPIGRSWDMTRSHFWPLLGAFALAFVFSIGVSTVAYALGTTLMMVVGGVGLFTQMQSEGGDFSPFSPMFIVGGLLYLMIQLAAAVVQTVLMIAPAAHAYRQLSAPPAAGAAA